MEVAAVIVGLFIYVWLCLLVQRKWPGSLANRIRKAIAGENPK